MTATAYLACLASFAVFVGVDLSEGEPFGEDLIGLRGARHVMSTVIATKAGGKAHHDHRR